MSFREKAGQLLADLFDHIDDLYGDIADVDEDGDSLRVEFDNGQVWLINIQIHHQEIWLSSPITGAHHYIYKADGWLNTRDNSQLKKILLTELSMMKN